MDYAIDQKTVSDIDVKVINSFDLECQTNYNSWSMIFDCDNISCKQIRTPMEYSGFLVRYSSKSETGIHYNDSEYEILNVKDGEIINLETGKTYRKGDILVIDKNEKHNIKAISEAYVFCIMTKYQSIVDTLTK